MFKLLIKNAAGEILAENSGEDNVSLAYWSAYNEGDRVCVEKDHEDGFIELMLDDAMGSEILLMKGNSFSLEVPFNEKKRSYSPKTFSGERHMMWVRKAYDFEAENYRNLAKNVYDHHTNETLFPHAYANVETRGESVFAARNAINGNCNNRSHGDWPFESWGINRQDDAEIVIDFGREVEIDKIILYTRADFPHDNWWKQVTFHFSDGSSLIQGLKKSYEPHIIPIEKRRVTWVKMNELLKDETDPSPFPALTQIEIYGK